MTTGRAPLDDCFLHDSQRMRHADVLALITGTLTCATGTQEVPLSAASGRWLAAPVSAPRNVPLHRNAAVDGYAYAGDASGSLRISARIAAGDTAAHSLAPGTAARIFTGAPMPAGADLVAMQEDCEVNGDTVTLPEGLRVGANVRHAGEDVAAGAEVLAAGARLRPQDIAALASLGQGQVSVRRPVRVAILSNGEELREPGEGIGPGQVYDSNRAMLRSLADTLPCQITDLGILPDDAQRIAAVIAGAAAHHDLILTSGGVSRGEEDHVVATIDRLGTRHLWQIAVKPGRPMSFGQIGACAIMGLPGNPVAAFVCFLMYVRPAITMLGGGTYAAPVRFEVRAGFELSKKPGRREFWRGWLAPGPDGLTAHKFARDGSGLISGLRQATGLIEAPEALTDVRVGETVSFLPFSQFGIDG